MLFLAHQLGHAVNATVDAPGGGALASQRLVTQRKRYGYGYRYIVLGWLLR